MEELKRTIGVVRRISYGLRPPELDGLGLAKSLEALASSVDRGNGTRVVVEATVDRGRLPAPNELCLYRVAQESLTNAMQHGEATRVQIVLREVVGSVVLSVRDNGKGFDELVVRRRDPSEGGLGLLGMRERVAEFGGTLTVRSAPGAGTRIVARLPMSPEQTDRSAAETCSRTGEAPAALLMDSEPEASTGTS